MAKIKKMMPPRNTVIRGQEHLLAYISPEEADILKSLGGSGEPGPMGIPAFRADPGQMAEAQESLGQTDYGGGGDEEEMNDPSSYGGVSDAQRNAALAEAEAALLDSQFRHGDLQSDMTPQDFAFDTGPSNADRVAQSYFDYADVFGPEIYSSNYIGGSIPGAIKNRSFSGLLGVPSYSTWMDHIPTRTAFANMAIDRLDNRISGYKNDQSLLGQRLAPVNTFFANNIKKALAAGGRPVLDSTGRVMGAFEKGPFGFGEVYTGTPVEGVEGTGFIDPDMGGEDVKPVNPATGQCDEGYIFDDDLQACRLDNASVASVDAPADGAYARMGLLDVAPTGLSDFQQRYGVGYGSPQDFADANTAFRKRGATYPEFFNKPPKLTGYTLLS